MLRFLAGAVALCGFALLSDVQAADTHHDAHALLKQAGHKPNTTHTLHNNLNGHSVHASTDNGSKVKSMHAMNGNKQVNPTKRLKSGQKHHVGLGSNGDYHYVSADVEEGCQDVQWIGFMFNLGGQIYIFWFPVTIVSIDPATCEAYNP